MNTELVLYDLSQYVVSGGDHPFAPGHQIKMRFPNGYGASIIRAYGSYGYQENKFELAVLVWDGHTCDLCYTTPITNDVLGHLTGSEVVDTLRNIMALPIRTPEIG